MSKASLLGIGQPQSAKSSRGRRQASESLYSMFEDAQVRQFKEAFSMIDQDSDGIIDEKDLVAMLTSMGKPPTSGQIAALLKDAGTQSNGRKGVNFTQFLTSMSARGLDVKDEAGADTRRDYRADHLLELDPEPELREAFDCFDDGDTGVIDSRELKKWLGDVGDKMSPEEIGQFLNGPFSDRKGNFHYNDFLKTLRIVDQEQQEQAQRQGVV